MFSAVFRHLMFSLGYFIDTISLCPLLLHWFNGLTGEFVPPTVYLDVLQQWMETHISWQPMKTNQRDRAISYYPHDHRSNAICEQCPSRQNRIKQHRQQTQVS